jgi:hypothetical protein
VLIPGFATEARIPVLILWFVTEARFRGWFRGLSLSPEFRG